MPRVRDSASDPHDFCRRCMPTAAEAEARFGAVGDGPDGRGNCFNYDEEHPPFAEEEYKCEGCGKRLTARDDYRQA
jgi:hypothetical protein